VREYIVQAGDTPASIASRDSMAGCPKCSRDLIAANLHKPTRTLPNGYTTFVELRPGEKLVIPEKWFTPEFDALPPTYFAALPHPDGVTPSKLGALAAGVLGDYMTFDSALAHAAMLTPMSIQDFSAAVDQVGALLNQSVSEVPASAGGPAQDVRASTAWARQRNAQLAAALKSGDETEALAARTGIENVLLTAIDSARSALQAVYGTALTPTGTSPATVLTTAKAAAAAIAADPNYCTSVAHSGTPVNAAIHNFKTAWNTANPSALVPVGTGNYEQATADALARALGIAAPAACVPRVVVEFGTPVIEAPARAPSEGLSTGALIGVALLGASVVGGVIYLATRDPAPKVRRVRPRPSPRPVLRPRPNPVLRPERRDTIPPWRPS
jgi:hypothetical protein